MTDITTINTAHITFKGQSADLDMNELEVNTDSTNEEILEAVARHFDRAIYDMDGYEVVREANGNLTIRPQAGFGK